MIIFFQNCMVKAGPADLNEADERLLVALRFPNLFAIDHKAITDTHIDELKQYFTVEETSELISFCAIISASQRLGAALGLQP